MELNCLVTRLGVLIDINELKNIIGYNLYVSLLDQLTIKKTKKLGNNVYVKTMQIYKHLSTPETSYLNLARFSGFKSILLKLYDQHIIFKYTNKIQSGTKINFNTSIKLEEHQKICLNYLMDKIYNTQKINNGSASCIFVMDTGLGKTYLAAALIEKIKEKTLIIIPNTSNLAGWHDPFKIYLKDIKIGEYHAHKKEDGDIIIITIDSALNDTFIFKNKNKNSNLKEKNNLKEKVEKSESITLSSSNFFKQFGLVIYDEIHNYSTEIRQEIFWRTNFKYGLGLTATPSERLDELDIVYYKHVGPIIDAKNIPNFSNYIKNADWKGHVLTIDYSAPEEYSQSYKNAVGWTDYGKMLKQLAADPYRNQLLINQIKRLYNSEHDMFVFFVHRDHLLHIHEKLLSENLPTSTNLGESDNLDKNNSNDDPNKFMNFNLNDLVTFMGGLQTKIES